MSFYGVSGQGYSDTHCWMPSIHHPGLYQVWGTSAFSGSGYAVVNDFGTLIEVHP